MPTLSSLQAVIMTTYCDDRGALMTTLGFSEWMLHQLNTNIQCKRFWNGNIFCADKHMNLSGRPFHGLKCEAIWAEKQTTCLACLGLNVLNVNSNN